MLRSVSPIIGKFGAAPWVSLMSSDHFACLSTGSTLSPISLTPRWSNSPFNFASAPSSVVQTGVKSFGCENKSAQLLPIQSWNLILPSVVSASKSGATAPIGRAIIHLIYFKLRGNSGVEYRRRGPLVNGRRKKGENFSSPDRSLWLLLLIRGHA